MRIMMNMMLTTSTEYLLCTLDLKLISDTASELVAGLLYYGLICDVADKKRSIFFFRQVFRDIFIISSNPYSATDDVMELHHEIFGKNDTFLLICSDADNLEPPISKCSVHIHSVNLHNLSLNLSNLSKKVPYAQVCASKSELQGHSS